VATHKYIAELIVKHRRNILSDQERQELQAWCGLCEENQLLFERLNREAYHTDSLVEFYSEAINEERGKVRPLFPRQRRQRYVMGITYVVIILCLLFTGIFLYSRLQGGAGKKSTATNGPVREDVSNVAVPDVHRVQLKLANRRIVYLDSSVNGHIALQYRSVIYKQGDAVRYEWSNGDAQPELEYNTISTPRTRKFVVELPDGSKAWLNASSSITFPTAFINKERIVQITGEVYFEVNPQPVSPGTSRQTKPFIVYAKPLPGAKAGGAMIEVMGTHFNINGYGDEPAIKTTVLQGKVRVSNQFHELTDIIHAVKGTGGKAAGQPNAQSAVLIPGQQANINGDGQLEVIKYADIQEVMAWQKDLFIFTDLDIKQIMQQLCRQYDLEVEYKEPVTGHYTLSMTRQPTVEPVLKALELSGGINFDIEGHKIIVSQ